MVVDAALAKAGIDVDPAILAKARQDLLQRSKQYPTGQLPARSSERIVSAMKGLVIVGLLLGVVISDVAPRLKVSDNKRFLVREDGSPFFYLGDTAWELFHRLSREEADRYLEDRARPLLLCLTPR